MKHLGWGQRWQWHPDPEGGVNLQNHCRHLIHLDIPWNPRQLEQPNGRIDRKPQLAPQVWCHYFLLEDRPEERVMGVLIENTEVDLRGVKPALHS